MRGLADTLEKHHKVRILDEAVEDAVKLSHRYITDRQLPDKCGQPARHGLRPRRPEPDRRRRRRWRTAAARSSISTSRSTSSSARAPSAPTTTLGSTELQGEEDRQPRRRWPTLEKRWDEEKKLVEQIQELRDEARDQSHAADRKADAKAKLSPATRARPREDLAELESELDRAPGRRAAGAAGRRRPGGRRGRRPAGPASRSARWSATKSRRC